VAMGGCLAVWLRGLNCRTAASQAQHKLASGAKAAHIG